MPTCTTLMPQTHCTNTSKRPEAPNAATMQQRSHLHVARSATKHIRSRYIHDGQHGSYLVCSPVCTTFASLPTGAHDTDAMLHMVRTPAYSASSIPSVGHVPSKSSPPSHAMMDVSSRRSPSATRANADWSFRRRICESTIAPRCRSVHPRVFMCT